MTVQTNTNVASFNGNGVTQIFPIAFKFNNATDLVVLLVEDATGAAVRLTLNSDYTVSGEGDEEGGLINVVAAPAVGSRLLVTRVVDILQMTDLRNQGKFFAEVHEDAFDLLTMIAQQHQSDIARSLRVAETDPEPARIPPAVLRAGKLLAFDNDGNPTTALPVEDSSTELRQDLASLDLGGSLVARIGSVRGSVSELAAVPTDKGQAVLVQSYHAGLGIGGGVFYWDATRAKSTHNGGTVISPTVQWDGQKGTVNEFVAGTGETDLGGLGCWVRACDKVSFADFGAIPYDIDAAFDSAVTAQKALDCGLHVDISNKRYRSTATLYHGNLYRFVEGNGDAAILIDSATADGYVMGVDGQNLKWTRFFGITIQCIHSSGRSTGRALIVKETRESEIEVSTMFFDKGLYITSASSPGVVYNKFYLRTLWMHKFSIHIFPTGSGWVNENNFYGGRFTTIPEVSATFHVWIEKGTTSYGAPNNNKFWGPSFEGTAVRAYVDNGAYNALYEPRTEGTWSGGDPIVIGVDAMWARVVASYIDANVTNNGMYSEIECPAYKLTSCRHLAHTGTAANAMVDERISGASRVLALRASRAADAGALFLECINTSTSARDFAVHGSGAIEVGGTAPVVGPGRLGIGGATATTVGAAGVASALPSTPQGYLIVNIGGTQCKIPFYRN